MLYDEIGDKDAFEEVSVKLKSKEAQLKQYMDSKGHLHRRKDREQVVGFDRRVSAEAVKSNKSVTSATKSVAKVGVSDIIKVDAKPGTSKYRKLQTEEIIKRCVEEKVPVFTDDNFGKYIKTIPKKDGFYDVAMHGAPKTVELFGKRTDVKVVAKILRQRKDYHNTPIRLLSCYTGKGEDCFAQRLANE